jgi:hypothetical protein
MSAKPPEPIWAERHRIRRGYPKMYCRECRGSGKSLTTHCVVRMLTNTEEADIIAGRLDFVNGQWITKEK